MYVRKIPLFSNNVRHELTPRLYSFWTYLLKSNKILEVIKEIPITQDCKSGELDLVFCLFLTLSKVKPTLEGIFTSTSTILPI